MVFESFHKLCGFSVCQLASLQSRSDGDFIVNSCRNWNFLSYCFLNCLGIGWLGSLFLDLFLNTVQPLKNLLKALEVLWEAGGVIIQGLCQSGQDVFPRIFDLLGGFGLIEPCFH